MVMAVMAVKRQPTHRHHRTVAAPAAPSSSSSSSSWSSTRFVMLTTMSTLAAVLFILPKTTSGAAAGGAFTTDVVVANAEDDGRHQDVRLTPIKHWWFLGPFPVGKTELDGDPTEMHGGITAIRTPKSTKGKEWFTPRWGDAR